ncbi:hypothetical protein [Hymenobacter guriensis]|uniref:DUF3471 domain-containing protein n=1 Tax=Hymenobacter guriensis TaxID=2793065 RepID=A0ABS0L021_9BACT|nr:hypothetical protein [Hymenobacter guriensis]MBG8553459.1 hypothetical protein [Hymenobacter guriensis]
MARLFLLSIVATLSSCHHLNQKDVTGTYAFWGPFRQSLPLGRLVLTERNAIYGTTVGEFVLDYTVEDGTVYLQMDDHTRLAFRIVHPDTLRTSMGLMGNADYVRVHE